MSHRCAWHVLTLSCCLQSAWSLGVLWILHSARGSTLELLQLLQILPILLIPLQGVVSNVAEEMLGWIGGSFLCRDMSCTSLPYPAYSAFVEGCFFVLRYALNSPP